MIAHSWRRSELSGVRPDTAPPTTTVDIASADPLLDAARPVLDAAAPQLAETNMSLLLVDHECRMVTRVAFGSTVERALDDQCPGHAASDLDGGIAMHVRVIPVEARNVEP